MLEVWETLAAKQRETKLICLIESVKCVCLRQTFEHFLKKICIHLFVSTVDTEPQKTFFLLFLLSFLFQLSEIILI